MPTGAKFRAAWCAERCGDKLLSGCLEPRKHRPGFKRKRINEDVWKTRFNFVDWCSNWLRRDFFDNVFDNSDSCPCPCSYSNTDANTNSDSDADTNSNSNSHSHSHPNSDDTGTMVHIAVHDADKPHPRRPSQYRQGAGDRGFWQ